MLDRLGEVIGIAVRILDVGSWLSPRHVVGLAKRASAEGLDAFQKVIDVLDIDAEQDPLRVCPAWVSACAGLGSGWTWRLRGGRLPGLR